jgi:hypothetical protein
MAWFHVNDERLNDDETMVDWIGTSRNTTRRW